MEGIQLLEPTELFNLLNQESVYPCVTDPVFMLLIDAREREDYNEGHIITAKHASKSNDDDHVVPVDAEIECKTHVVVYDNKASTLSEQSPAVLCAKKLWDSGSRNTVKVLNGGFEKFSALYPFLRTHKILYTPQEMDSFQTYPAEVIRGLLYLGHWKQANNVSIQKDLKIKGLVNCCEIISQFSLDEGLSEVHIAVSDDEFSNETLSALDETCKFIDCHQQDGKAVLVFSRFGLSRAATVVIAFLMKANHLTAKDAFGLVAQCRPQISSSCTLMALLVAWEAELRKSKPDAITESVVNIRDVDGSD